MTNIDSAGTTTQTTGPSARSMDWGRGQYELTAASLAPAAEAVVRAATVHAGEHVLDVGCGTGNVALIAARAGAQVTAVDPAPRLLEVTRSLAQREGLELQLLLAEAASLPLPDASFDAVLSNFAVIFSPEPTAAIAEMVRVMGPDGRIVFSAWLPGETIGRMNAAAMDLVRGAVGAPPPPTPYGWHEQAVLDTAFAAHGMTVTVEQRALAFTGSSPAAYLDADRANHPLAIAGFEVLERAGQADRARKVMLQILEEGNEDPHAFRSTSSYVVVSATRP